MICDRMIKKKEFGKMKKSEIIEKLREKIAVFEEIIKNCPEYDFFKDHNKKLTPKERAGVKASNASTEIQRLISDTIFLVKATDIKDFEFAKDEPLRTGKALFSDTRTGDFVAVRPCSKEYSNKTFLGVYLGEAALSQGIKLEDGKLKTNLSHYNPAIFVPDLNEIIYGCGSWWGKIESAEDLKQISDTDINNVWYVKALKNLNT